MLEQKREQQLSVIADMETQPQNRASMLFSAAVYGDHPYGRSAYGKKPIVEKLMASDLKAFHAAAYAPNATIVAECIATTFVLQEGATAAKGKATVPKQPSIAK